MYRTNLELETEMLFVLNVDYLVLINCNMDGKSFYHVNQSLRQKAPKYPQGSLPLLF